VKTISQTGLHRTPSIRPPIAAAKTPATTALPLLETQQLTDPVYCLTVDHHDGPAPTSLSPCSGVSFPITATPPLLSALVSPQQIYHRKDRERTANQERPERSRSEKRKQNKNNCLCVIFCCRSRRKSPWAGKRREEETIPKLPCLLIFPAAARGEDAPHCFWRPGTLPL